MNRNLFLVRHAQPHHSQSYNSDKERELKPEGILQANQLGKYLNESNYNINLIMTSDAVRAKTTATLIANTINYPTHQIKWAEKIYSGGLNELLAILKETPDDTQHLLLVGHNPTISELAIYLSGAPMLSMSTCELNLIQINTMWTELGDGCGKHVLSYQPAYK
jgi:phosphohistidine phosphatase